MITLPFLCNIEKNQQTSMVVSSSTFKVDTRLEHIRVEDPNPLVEAKRIVKYSGLSLADSKTLEDTLKGTYGTERISYLGKKYRIRAYKIMYNNSTASAELELEQVA